MYYVNDERSLLMDNGTKSTFLYNIVDLYLIVNVLNPTGLIYHNKRVKLRVQRTVNNQNPRRRL